MIGNDAEVRPFVRICHSDYSTYFGWVLYVLEGALLSFGAFLAWETRNVGLLFFNGLLKEFILDFYGKLRTQAYI